MATTFTREPINDDSDRIEWLLGAGETGDACEGLSDLDDRSVQFSGTFSGATIAMKGSNTKADLFEPLMDTGYVLIAGINDGSRKLRQIVEYTHRIRPEVSGGDGSTAILISLVAKRKRN